VGVGGGGVAVGGVSGVGEGGPDVGLA